MSSSITKREMKEYIKHTSQGYWYQNYPEDYEVVRKLYDIFICGDKQYNYARYDIMCKEIENFIGSFIDDFEGKYCII